jgi:Protein of unknown function (DUF1214)
MDIQFLNKILMRIEFPLLISPNFAFVRALVNFVHHSFLSSFPSLFPFRNRSHPIRGVLLTYRLAVGEDYLLRAAVTKVGFAANIPQQAVYHLAFLLLNAANNTNYLMHFGKGQVPPVKGFWSLTMYDKDGLFRR